MQRMFDVDFDKVRRDYLFFVERLMKVPTVFHILLAQAMPVELLEVLILTTFQCRKWW